VYFTNYVEKFGIPQNIRKSRNHKLIEYFPHSGQSRMSTIEYMEDGKVKQGVPCQAKLASERTDAYFRCLFSWTWYAHNPNYCVENLIEEAYLLRCCLQYEAGNDARSVALPSRRQQPPNV